MSLGEILRRKRIDLGLTVSQVAASTQMKPQTIEDIEKEDFRRISAPIYGKGFIKLYAEHVGLDPVPLVNEYANRFAKTAMPSLVSDQPPKAVISKEEAVKSETVKTPPVSQAPLPPVTEKEPVKVEIKAVEKAPEPRREKPKEEKIKVAADPIVTKTSGAAEAVRTLFSRMADSIANGLRNMKSASDRMWSWQPKFSSDDINGKNISIALGVLIVIIFAASSISQCGKKREQTAEQNIRHPVKDLSVAFEPPEPYLD